MVAVGVAEQWSQIVRWLSVHAPTTGAALRTMALPEDVLDLEHELGVQIPDELFTWWSVCGGVSTAEFAEVIPPFYTPYGPREALEAWRKHRKLWLDTWERPDCDVEAGSAARSYHPAWVPFAFDGLGDDLVIDLRPGPLRGCVLEWDHEVCQLNGPEWTSVDAMLAEVATALEHGSPVGHCQPAVTTDGRLDWRIR
ncbi:glucan synthase [Gandjariella thermophila]|uniref:Glucan synthase n=1 Tax=Gandjariella thermophila TaxID=1931992 RepID=A0A4D4J3V7_9PSEU|nr:glucan synthase [Gandjariella thermophila]